MSKELWIVECKWEPTDCLPVVGIPFQSEAEADAEVARLTRHWGNCNSPVTFGVRKYVEASV